MTMTRTEIEIIATSKNWQGYIWMVDDKNPDVFEYKAIDWAILNKTKTVFNRIQEANLYCVATEESIHIKNIDGVEFCYLYDLKSFDNDKENYLLEDFDAVPASKGVLKPLLFKQLYKNTPNLISEGFETWQPVCKIFVGFSK